PSSCTRRLARPVPTPGQPSSSSASCAPRMSIRGSWAARHSAKCCQIRPTKEWGMRSWGWGLVRSPQPLRTPEMPRTDDLLPHSPLPTPHSSLRKRSAPMSKHTLVATVEEGPATLNRVLSLFRQRSFAIESLSIGRTNEPGIMRLTMVVDGARSAIEQVTKQLYKVVEVRKVSDLSEDARVERELALVKVTSKSAAQRAEVMQIADIYRARIVDVASGSLMVEVT